METDTFSAGFRSNLFQPQLKKHHRVRVSA